MPENQFLHDLATPLATVLVFLEAAGEDLSAPQPDVAEVSKCVEDALAAARALKALLDQRVAARRAEARP